MVTIYKLDDSKFIPGGGYARNYVAEVIFKKPPTNAGFINVKIPPGVQTTPHAHEKLEEVFVILNPTKIGIGTELFEVDEGDIIVVEPGEMHWFDNSESGDTQIIAIKFPNLSSDRITR